jgi:hypothetical protein
MLPPPPKSPKNSGADPNDVCPDPALQNVSIKPGTGTVSLPKVVPKHKAMELELFFELKGCFEFFLQKGMSCQWKVEDPTTV